jgi:hypothetical protein
MINWERFWKKWVWLYQGDNPAFVYRERRNP